MNRLVPGHTAARRRRCTVAAAAGRSVLSAYLFCLIVFNIFHNTHADERMLTRPEYGSGRWHHRHHHLHHQEGPTASMRMSARISRKLSVWTLDSESKRPSSGKGSFRTRVDLEGSIRVAWQAGQEDASRFGNQENEAVHAALRVWIMERFHGELVSAGYIGVGFAELDAIDLKLLPRIGGRGEPDGWQAQVGLLFYQTMEQKAVPIWEIHRLERKILAETDVATPGNLSQFRRLTLSSRASSITVTPAQGDDSSTSMVPSISPGLFSEIPSGSPSPLLSKAPLASSPPSNPPSSVAPSGSPSPTSPPSTTSMPSSQPSPVPSGVPSLSHYPSVTLSTTPSLQPTPAPSISSWPSAFPSASPSSSPTISDSPTHSVVPSSLPSPAPSPIPSMSPQPSSFPSDSPSDVPSEVPSERPSLKPTISERPSLSPSFEPTLAPTTSLAPSCGPSVQPSDPPSEVPTNSPSILPSYSPSSVPSVAPSVIPSQSPSLSPSVMPSLTPTIEQDFDASEERVTILLIGVQRDLTLPQKRNLAIQISGFVKDFWNDYDDDGMNPDSPVHVSRVGTQIKEDTRRPEANGDEEQGLGAIPLEIVYGQEIKYGDRNGDNFTDLDPAFGNLNETLFLLPLLSQSLEFTTLIGEVIAQEDPIFLLSAEISEPPTPAPNPPDTSGREILLITFIVILVVTILLGATGYVVYLLKEESGPEVTVFEAEDNDVPFDITATETEGFEGSSRHYSRQTASSLPVIQPGSFQDSFLERENYRSTFPRDVSTSPRQLREAQNRETTEDSANLEGMVIRSSFPSTLPIEGSSEQRQEAMPPVGVPGMSMDTIMSRSEGGDSESETDDEEDDDPFQPHLSGFQMKVLDIEDWEDEDS